MNLDDILYETRSRLLVIALAMVTCLWAAPQLTQAQDADEDEGITSESADEGNLSNRDLFADFLHNAVLGKFQRADSYAQKLLANHPDPLEVLKFADEHTNSLKTLILLVNNVEVSSSANKVLELIHEGELLRRQNPQRIKINIDKLGGDPQTEFHAINRLRESGEYAIPWLVRTLQDKTKARLQNRIIRMLPRMGKEAVNPLVISLAMDDHDTMQFVVRTLGEISYPQALPYLLAVLERPSTTAELKEEVNKAIMQIMSSNPAASVGSASDSFLELARQYYTDHGSVKADPRNDFANVWYWAEGRLQRTEVPRTIFNEIMTMRCSEQALKLNPGADQAIGLWLAANIRREAELGMDVESTESDPVSAADPTKEDSFPRSAYFARAAGARYCHMVLDLAMEHSEPAVALGAITALRLVAGATNLIGTEDYKQPLVLALTFPDQVVRIKAALALTHALPSEPFAGSDRVMPVITEALSQTGKKYVLVIDPDEQNLNRILNAIRNDQTIVIGEKELYPGLERARRELPTVTSIFLASDLNEPGLASAVATLRENSMFALTPVVLLTGKGTADEANALASSDEGITTLVANASQDQLLSAWQALGFQTGQSKLDQAEALALALDAAESLRKIAFSHSTVYDFSLAEGSLIHTLSSPDEILQTTSASVLALSSNSNAQQAIAKVALNSGNTESLRIAAFNSLAESAKVNGNLLTEDSIDMLIDLAINEPNLTIRSAGSQALGALNLPSNKSGQIIDKFYRG